MKKVALRVVAFIFFAIFLFALFANIKAIVDQKHEALAQTIKLLLSPDKALMFINLIWANSIKIGIGLLLIMAPLLLSKFFWGLANGKPDNSKTFIWWRLQGWILLSYSGYALVYLCLNGWLQSGSAQNYFILISFLAIAFFSILCIKMNVWAFAAITVASLNPELWIVNAIYLKNRWNSHRIKGLESLRNRNSR
jgi:hypothetical protein